MTSRQRSVAAMTGQATDWVPCVPLIDNSYSAAVLGMPVSECFINPARHAESLSACLVKHPLIDGLSINLCLSDEIILDRERTTDGWLIKTTGGLTWYVPYHDIGSVAGREIVSFDDPRLISDNPFQAGVVETLAGLSLSMRNSHCVLAGVTGPFSHIAFLMGLERVMLATADDPVGLLRAVEKRLPLALSWVDEMARFDPAAIWIGEGFASSNLISPRVYREFVLPFEKIVCEKIRSLGIPSVLHICGRLAPAALDAIAASETDCLEIDWPVNVVQTRARLGKGVALKGNLNTTTLVQAGPETIYQLSRELVEAMEGQTGFILSSGCALGRDTPPANVDAMAQATRTG